LYACPKRTLKTIPLYTYDSRSLDTQFRLSPMWFLVPYIERNPVPVQFQALPTFQPVLRIVGSTQNDGPTLHLKKLNGCPQVDFSLRYSEDD
jgi:hypothetical protein